MDNLSTDIILQNLQKIRDRYQEIILHLVQGKGNFFPSSLVDIDKTLKIFTNIYQQTYNDPKKFLQNNVQYTEKLCSLVEYSVARFSGLQGKAPYNPSSKDKRFKDTAWQNNIFFDFIKQFYLLSSEWLQQNIAQYELTTEEAAYLEFVTRQFIDAFSPSNFVFCNPEVIRETFASSWQNVVQGLDNFLTDIKKSGDVFSIPMIERTAFQLGKDIAATEGKVIFQNDLIQLICYSPANEVHSVPLLIVPPWINKYYILDLSSNNSMVSFLRKHNFQLFIISWKNPDCSLAHKNFEDYLQDGLLAACKSIMQLGFEKINAVGYCLGGTLLATGLSYMKAHALEYINSASFLATLLDFADPGEVGVFINKASIAAIEEEVSNKGYFDGRYLLNSFSLLRANDLIWSFFINNYLLGKAPVPFDILYWNADYTNLPAAMHSYYLHNMYLDNLLRVPNALKMLHTPIDLSKIDCPAFFLAAREDHIAPWKGVYEGAKLLNGAKKFCLTKSGHVAGVINPPSSTKYSYRTYDNLDLSSEEWLQRTKEFEGSWWTEWVSWLAGNSGNFIDSINYTNLNSIEPAPGSYVR